MPYLGERVAITESLNRDLYSVSLLCDLWGIKLNASKTKTMTVSSLPQFITLSVLKKSAVLVLLSVTFDGF